jgi:hypothetical protein
MLIRTAATRLHFPLESPPPTSHSHPAVILPTSYTINMASTEVSTPDKEPDQLSALFTDEAHTDTLEHVFSLLQTQGLARCLAVNTACLPTLLIPTMKISCPA